MPGFRPRFFAPVSGGSDPVLPGPGSVLPLDAEDSHHALRVLRLRPGDECEIVVGAAVYAATVISRVTPGSGGTRVQVRLEEGLEGQAAGADYRFRVALVQALTRSSALDWSIEKSTEAGASLVVLVQSAGSPRFSGADPGKRRQRWARIAREAAKQSKQPVVPPVELAPSLAAALEHLRSLGFISVLLDPGAEVSLFELVQARAGALGSQVGEGGVALWVGPESGFTAEERESLTRERITAARLGRGVLRTETAGPLAVAVTRLALGDW